jgi:hypothetical protein
MNVHPIHILGVIELAIDQFIFVGILDFFPVNLIT